MIQLSIIVRCSGDPRVIACLDSIDSDCEIVGALTPDRGIERTFKKRRIPFAVTRRGNPAATTNAALSLISTRNVLLVDSDCRFLPGAIDRMRTLAESAEIVRASIDFGADGVSSRSTAICRHFQYTYRSYVYEPGLLLRLDRVLPMVGGYLFDAHAPFTPDGELDYRLRTSGALSRLRVVTDPHTTLQHAPLSFARHLRSYWRYGASEASRMTYLNQQVLSDFVSGLPQRYAAARSAAYHFATPPLIAICDGLYVVSMAVNRLRAGTRAHAKAARA